MRATEFITELFKQSTVPWVWGHRSSDEASVSFTVGQQHYRFYACNSPDDPEEWEIEFAATSKYSNGPSNDKLKYDYGLNGAGSGALVMSTVVSIMREFLKEYKHKISSIQFSAKEKSRQKLYTRMLQRLLPSWTFSRSIDSLSGSEKYLLTKPSDITEVINTDIMHRNFKHQQQIGDYIFKARSERFHNQKVLRISCYKGKEEIGLAQFEIIGPGHGSGSDSRLESEFTWVAKDHRQEGIASTMYAYAKMLGNDIAPSSSQLPPGKKMWDAWKNSGDAKHLMKEEINTDILHPGFSHAQKIGDYIYKATVHGWGSRKYLKIQSLKRDTTDPLDIIAEVIFITRGDEKHGYLESMTTWVADEFRNKGIASTIYAYVRMLGNTVKPSTTRTPDGEAMWNAWEKTGDAEHLMREEINPDILHPEFKHKQVIGDYTYTAIWNGDRELRIRCYDGRKIVGQVDFYAWSSGKTAYLASGGTEVKPEYRKKGIAYTMYAYAKMLGNDIRSGALSPDGRAMWDAWKKSGEAEHLMAEEEPIKISNNNAAKAWIERVYQKYPYTMQNNHVMTWGSGDDQQFAMFELTPSFSKRGAVEVKWFQAYPLRQGVGSRAMQELQAMAREDGISLTLYPWDKGQVSQSKLTKFYRGQGFAPAVKGSKHMQWEPK